METKNLGKSWFQIKDDSFRLQIKVKIKQPVRGNRKEIFEWFSNMVKNEFNSITLIEEPIIGLQYGADSGDINSCIFHILIQGTNNPKITSILNTIQEIIKDKFK